MQNQRMPKQTANSYSGRNRKRGRRRKAWRDEFEEDLNTVGLKTGREMARDSRG
jgi:hypothetical protein